MDFDNEFYKQWKTKSRNNRIFFKHDFDFFKEKLNKSKVCSPTLVEQSETETFSLRLSESCVDESQESDKKKLSGKDEVILISDSSSNGSMFSCDKSNMLTNNINKKYQKKKGIDTIESYLETVVESTISPIYDNNIHQTRTSNSVFMEKSKAIAIIDESESDIDNKIPKIIQNNVIESVTLSERKKKEIMQWLLKNVENSKYETSFSQDSAIANSRKSGLSSGNSSLERLELNFETPNNRGKLRKYLTSNDVYEKKIQVPKGQSKLDQYFTKVKKKKLNICKDITPKAKATYKTKINNFKVKTKTELPETNIINYKKLKENNFYKTSIKNIKTNLEITENETSDDISVSSIKRNSKAVIIPETQILTSIDYGGSSENIYDVIGKDKPPTVKPTVIPESISLEINDDSEESKSSINLNLKNKKIYQKNIVSNLSPEVHKIVDDCADILEHLYGETWRTKANTLIPATELKTQRERKIFKDVQTEKKLKVGNQRFDIQTSEFKSNSILPNITKNFIVQTKGDQSVYKTIHSKINSKNTLLNNESTTESSPDCSYYTAVMNPTPLQDNKLKNKTSLTQKVKTKNNIYNLLSICDSDSDYDNENWKNRQHYQRKLSFDSSSCSSFTSEFDPGDIVLPKTTKKDLKIVKSVNLASAKLKIIQNQMSKKSFLASLSKNVLPEHADFRAMAYRVNYSTMRQELCEVLFKLFNANVFENQLPDNMLIEWSVRLRGTAGKCYNKQSLKALGKTVRSSRIVLATKILDSPDRLRDTLIHEMCHAATWLINNVSDGHGSFWKAWADKAMKVFPELPPISRCHNYEIQTKYTYKCRDCGYSIGRHSKSLDIKKKRCGYCHGTFEILINKFTKAGKVQAKSTAQTKELSGFALYVKENYQLVKQTGVKIKHGEVMKILGQQFSSIKLTPKTENHIRNNENKTS